MLPLLIDLNVDSGETFNLSPLILSGSPDG